MIPHPHDLLIDAHALAARGIGTARPDEPAEALPLCWAWAMLGRDERRRADLLAGWPDLPPRRQRRGGGQ